MPEISFSLISSATLKSLEYLQVAPAEAVLDVTGPMMDPSSLQKFRDAISASFEAHRNNLAALLLKQDALVGKARNEKERDKLIKEFTKQQADAVRRIEKILQEKLDLVREKAAASAKATALKDAQVKVSVVWSAYKLTKAGLDMFMGDDAESGEAPSLTDRAALVKDLYDSLKELIKLAGNLWEYIQTEEDVRSQIEGTRKQIRLAKGKPVESLVAKLESQLKAHSPKIGAIERSAREMAQELEKLLAKVDAGGRDIEEQLAPSIDSCIKQIITLNEGVAQAQDYHNRSQDALRDAQKKQVKDPSSFWDYFKKIDMWYEAIDDWWNKNKIKDYSEQLESTLDEFVKEFSES